MEQKQIIPIIVRLQTRNVLWQICEVSNARMWDAMEVVHQDAPHFVT